MGQTVQNENPLFRPIEKMLDGKHYDRVHDLWERACLGLKIRERVCKRRLKNNYHQDPIYISLYGQCKRYYNLLDYLRNKGVKKDNNNG